MKMQIFKAEKKVGWFRPIYYFVPPAVALVVLLLSTAYFANSAKEAPVWLFVAGALTVCIQLVTAVREYRAWLFNWELRQAYTECAKALTEVLDDRTRNDDGDVSRENFTAVYQIKLPT